MDIRKIKKLIDLLEDTSITEIEIKEGEESVRLSRGSKVEPIQAIKPAFAAPQALAPLPVAISSDAPGHDKASSASTLPAGHQIRSPMVGTMYTAPSPEDSTFVTIGQVVKAGDTLCIIEAMKMFNEIETDRSGKIIAILVNNGDPVEYDQPLFILE